MGRNYIDKNNYGAVQNSSPLGAMTKEFGRKLKFKQRALF